jgi:hypothetical protein
MRNAYEMLVGQPEGKRSLEDLGVDGRIILKWILGVWVRRIGSGGGLL